MYVFLAFYIKIQRKKTFCDSASHNSDEKKHNCEGRLSTDFESYYKRKKKVIYDNNHNNESRPT